MGLPTRKRPKLGDVIEIATPQGFAYAQYTHRYDKPPRWVSLLRILPGLFESRPTDLSTLVQQRERFFVFFPLVPRSGVALLRSWPMRRSPRRQGLSRSCELLDQQTGRGGYTAGGRGMVSTSGKLMSSRRSYESSRSKRLSMIPC